MTDSMQPGNPDGPGTVDSEGRPSGQPVASYPPDAMHFVREGLEFTVENIHGPVGELGDDEDRHVDGRQLSLGLRDHAIRRFGLLAGTVLQNWNIHRSDDFGRIVYEMIKDGSMSKTDRDRIDHFFGVFDFDAAFSTEGVQDTLERLRHEHPHRV